MSVRTILIVVALLTTAVACKKGGTSAPTASPDPVGKVLAYAAPGLSGCDHDLETTAVAKHAWPYPADARDIRWGDEYQKMRLKLNPNPAAFYTATLTWKKGEFIEVEDSEMVIRKPRQVVAKHDIVVTRKVIDQGREVKRTSTAVAAGEVANFLFYNSRGSCMILTDGKPAWAPCTLEGSFEGVSADAPFACDQSWWVNVRRSRSDRGWMPFDEALMDRIPSPLAATR